jgi:hypothetical protein
MRGYREGTDLSMVGETTVDLGNVLNQAVKHTEREKNYAAAKPSE